MSGWAYILIGIVSGFTLTVIIEYFIAKNFFEKGGKRW